MFAVLLSRTVFIMATIPAVNESKWQALSGFLDGKYSFAIGKQILSKMAEDFYLSQTVNLSSAD